MIVTFSLVLVAIIVDGENHPIIDVVAVGNKNLANISTERVFQVA